MSRPTKRRRICRIPQTSEFFPAQETIPADAVSLTVDEYETIRLLDHVGLSQEQCSERMQIARTTVQKIYDSARKKLAQMLVESLPLRIEGGAYRLCDGKNSACTDPCARQTLHYPSTKGDSIVRLAVAYENGLIFQHFGHTEQFKIYDIADGKIVASEIVDTNGSGHGALADFLYSYRVDVLICGGIGGGAQMALASAGIQLFGGVAGGADAAVESFLAGNLVYHPNVQCDHHGEHHHGGGCGSHGCH